MNAASVFSWLSADLPPHPALRATFPRGKVADAEGG